MAGKEAIRVFDDHQYIRGFAYGLQQASFLGSVEIFLEDGFDYTAIDAVIGELAVEDLSPRTAAMKGPEGLVHRLIFCVMAIQRQQRIPMSFRYHCSVREDTSASGKCFFIAFPVHNPSATEATMEWAVSFLNAQISGGAASRIGELRHGFDELEMRIKRFASVRQNNIYIHQTAFLLDIPVSNYSGNMLRLGEAGAARIFSSTITDETSVLGINTAHNKVLTAQLLKGYGLPVPAHKVVKSEGDAVAAAVELGFPVVVKPFDKEQGLGVFANLINEDAVIEAWAKAGEVSASIIVEKHVEGYAHRLTVVQGKVIKVTKKLPGGVYGDGEKTIETLVEEANVKAQKRRLYINGAEPMVIDGEAESVLQQQGLSVQSIPAKGDYVFLRRRSNTVAGGRTIDLVVQQVHSDNLNLAVQAAAALGLDIAGVDLICRDIFTSWMTGGATICEVNAQPQTDIDTMVKIIRTLNRGVYSIPKHLVVYPADASLNLENLAANLAAELECDGWSIAGGVWVNRTLMTRRVANGYGAARILLRNAGVRQALILLSEDEIKRYGLPSNRFNSISYLDRSELSGDPSAIGDELQAMISPHGDTVIKRLDRFDKYFFY